MRARAAASLVPPRRIGEPLLATGLLCALYLILSPPSADFAAQSFRTGLFEDAGLAAWNNHWFAGHHVPGYSVLFPPLAALIGPRLVGVAAALVATALFAEIAHGQWGERARLGAVWFGAGTTISLFSGRLTFALGVAFAIAAVYAAQRGRRGISLGLAALCPLASPVAGLFLVGGGLVHFVAERRREGLELAAVALAAGLILAFAFPQGGSHPFVASSFRPALLVAIAVFVALPREERLLRAGVAFYAVALLASHLVENPMGGNATRMGTLLLGPLLACALWQRERFVLALIAPLLVYWQWSPVVRDLEEVRAEPSVQAGYYEPLKRFLARETGGRPTRVEIVPLANHWESAHVPERTRFGEGISIARGWVRQLDRKYNPLFYEDDLSPLAYQRWLDGLAVRYVALASGPVDYAGEAEAELIRGGLPYLRPVFRSRRWTVYEVEGAPPLASEPVRLARLSPDGFTLRSDVPTATLVRIRYTPYWAVTRGAGCVERSASGYTWVRIWRPGRIRIFADFSPMRLLQSGPRCRDWPGARLVAGQGAR